MQEVDARVKGGGEGVGVGVHHERGAEGIAADLEAAYSLVGIYTTLAHMFYTSHLATCSMLKAICLSFAFCLLPTLDCLCGICHRDLGCVAGQPYLFREENQQHLEQKLWA